MKNLLNYKNFVGEKFQINEAKQTTPVALFNKDVKNLLSDMFAKVKSPEFEYDKDGYPTKVEFEIVEDDFKVDYDEELKNEFTEGVLKKREYEPILIFDEKEQEGTENNKVFKIKFKIKKAVVEKNIVVEEGPRSKNFKKDSDEQLLKKLKSKKFNDKDKDKIIDILKDRGVEYDDPFKADIEKEITDEEMDKKAMAKAKTVKESLEIENFDEYSKKKEECDCGKKKECDCGKKKECDCGKETKDLNKLVEESLKIKKFDEMPSLNEMIDNITEFKVPRTIETEKK